MIDTPTTPNRSHVKPQANAMADKVCAHNKLGICGCNNIVPWNKTLCDSCEQGNCSG